MITDFRPKADVNVEKEQIKNRDIFRYIQDERILRVLFESQILELRDIQKRAIQQGLFFQKSFLICAPSGSGKTLVGELCAVYNIFQKFGKSAYLVPFKALATEKYFYFKRNYERFGVKVALSIGDFDSDDVKLEKADLIVTTYEKMDSILRNFYDKKWIFEITTIIIDEIHIIGENERGPRVESLIVRLNEFLKNPQILGLSATIANPEFFNKWLNSLGSQTILIKSDERPVPLNFKIEITQNKDSTIKKVVNETLDKGGQTLIFLNKRKSAQQSALILRALIKTRLSESEQKACKKLSVVLQKIPGSNQDLVKCAKNGVAFHHAGLLSKERLLIEENFKKRTIKVICCTTTLSAGINTPARTVILKDFKKFVTSGHNIKNFAGYFENGDGFSYFMPFSANEVFQILGRAGRPGLDSVGYGVILTETIDERNWVENHYFTKYDLNGKGVPRYNDLKSGLNRINTLKEQVLLRVYEEKKLSLEQLKRFFEKTYFWFCVKEQMNEQQIPIDQLLMIQEIKPENILKLHSQPNRLKEIRSKNFTARITEMSSKSISGMIKTDFGVYSCRFDIELGIQCSCGFENGISDNFADKKLSFEFCDHITSFLIYLITNKEPRIKKYMDDIVPKAAKNQYVLNYLFEKGLIMKTDEGEIETSQFGKLIIRLYLLPESGVSIREKLENEEIQSFKDLIKIGLDVMKQEYKTKDNKVLEPILEWADEEPIEKILERHKMMAGDLHNVRDNLERVLSFIGVIAGYLSSNGEDIRERLNKIAEMCETLKTRIHYGVKEELFDLVIRIDNVGRARARLMFQAGYHTASQVAKENPYVLHTKTGLGIELCKKIVANKNKEIEEESLGE